MSGPNLIIVFSPTLHISQNLLNVMFQHVDEFIGDAAIIKYANKYLLCSRKKLEKTFLNMAAHKRYCGHGPEYPDT
jgi:hypothetical protein